MPEVLQVLDRTLNLRGRGMDFDTDTPLLGALPELDSMAVLALINGIEHHFGIMLPDDELDGSVFATVGSLSKFIETQVQLSK